jgi:hypothetical protein
MRSRKRRGGGGKGKKKKEKNNKAKPPGNKIASGSPFSDLNKTKQSVSSSSRQ